ncbi:MAG: orotidine-5'-phosphate decarboxylase [Candidatus Muiribacteriota bacterium]
MAEIFVALDMNNGKKALDFAYRIRNYADGFKIGLELFCAEGPEIVDKVSDFGKVFLDLKFHDIPNTILKASQKISGLNVFMFNMHALAGSEAMKNVVKSVRGKNEKIKIIAVTMLTSMNKNTLDETGFKSNDINNQVLKLACLARESGMDGVVCSPGEVKVIKNKLGRNFITVVPGIRPAGSANNDQKRVATPEEAVKNGADFLILGRPVRLAPDPVKALIDIRNQMEENHAG